MEEQDRFTPLLAHKLVAGCFRRCAKFQKKIAPLVVDGSIRCETTVRESIEKMPDAFLEFFSGGNTGKMIVKL